MERRQYLAATVVAATTGLAGCSGAGAEHSGTVSQTTQHNVEVERGETVRVEASNDEGPRTTITIVDPEGEIAVQERVEVESTITHAAEVGGVFRVIINTTGTTTYEIYVDAEE